MFNLFILTETFTNGLNYNLINFISFASVLCGIFVIISKNPIVSVLFLIGLFFNIAGYLMMLGMNFIGLSYLLVYVGAVSILFLFILMLINVRVSELIGDTGNSLPLAVIIGISFFIIISKLSPSNPIAFYILYESVSPIEGGLMDTAYPVTESISLFPFEKKDLSLVTSQIWDGALAESSHITSIGNIIYTSYPIWLILTSLILLLAMVGTIVITISPRKDVNIRENTVNDAYVVKGAHVR